MLERLPERDRFTTKLLAVRGRNARLGRLGVSLIETNKPCKISGETTIIGPVGTLVSRFH